MIHFSLAYWCVLAAAVLPIVCAGIAKSGRFVPLSEGGYDNRSPRDWLAQHTQWRGRANAAQANAFEAFPFFAVGVIVASLAPVSAERIALLSVIYVLARLVYIYCYISDRPAWRSMVWGLAMACAIALYGLAIAA